MFYLYKWSNLIDNSPHESVRNEWLYKYGAFARMSGIWFPCKVLRFSTIGEPATISVVPLATVNMELYPTGEINVSDCEYFYSVFPNGMAIQTYIQKGIALERVTDRMLFGAIKRSLNTELLFASKQYMKDVKRAANREDKSEVFVVNANNKDDIGVIELPKTVDIIEKLWNNKDWAKQEISQMLGLTYNPSHGKKERVITSELLGDRDLTIMNREMISNRLIHSAEKYGEKVYHISSLVDQQDRELMYGATIEPEKDGEQ